MRAQRLAILTAAAALAATALAETKVLRGENTESDVGSATSPVEWGVPDNWEPVGVPGREDTVNWAVDRPNSYHHAYIALDGDYSISMLTNNYRCLHLYKSPLAAESMVTFTVNTQLNGTGYTKGHEVNDGVKFVLPKDSLIVFSKGDHTYSGFDVKPGGALEILGSIQSRVMKLDIEDDASLVFAPASYAIPSWGRTNDDHDEINITGGESSFPGGITMTGSASTPDNQINHSDGVVTFGGNFTSQMPWTYTWSGGRLAVTDDVAFGSNVRLAVPASSSVTLDVAQGKTFAAPNITADSSATIEKTGDGVFSFSPVDASVAVRGGGIGLATDGTYDLSRVTFAQGTTVSLAALGATVNSYDASLEQNATFAADLSAASAGAIVLNSTSPALLEKAKTDLAGSLPSGFGFSINGTTLLVETQSAYNFRTSGEIGAAAGWGEALPPDGADVAVSGEGVVATLSSGAFPAWNSIEVKNGATLCVTTDATLPHVILSLDATLEIAGGATVTLADAANLTGNATASQLPVVSVAAGATLNVPGGMKFRNVNVDLKGTVATTSDGGITFGYAAARETTYIGFTAAADSVIDIKEGSSSSYGLDALEFCCPAVGGTVVAVDALTLTGVKLPKSSGHDYTTGHHHGFHLGVNNPSAEMFEVIFDSMRWGVGGKVYIKGGATFRLRNNAAFINYEHHTAWDRYAEISEKGRLVVDEGCEFRLNALGNYGDRSLVLNPSEDGFQSIVVKDGGVFETYRSSGSRKGVFAAEGQVEYRVFEPYIYYETSLGQVYSTKNIPFEGLSSVEVKADSVLKFTTRNQANGHGYFNSGDDRVVSLADVPITGGGSIALDNANANVFGVIVKSGSNTATGSAGVVAPAAGEGATTLWFDDGANWAGTVIAGNVALTNTAGSAAASADFARLDLADGAEFPVRVWKVNGVVSTNDTLNVGLYVNNGGAIALVPAGGATLDDGDRVTLGTIGENSPLPKVVAPEGCGRWEARRDAGTGLLEIVRRSGFVITIR